MKDKDLRVGCVIISMMVMWNDIIVISKHINMWLTYHNNRINRCVIDHFQSPFS